MAEKTRYQIQREGKLLCQEIDAFLHRGERDTFTSVAHAAEMLAGYIARLRYRGEQAGKMQRTMLAVLTRIAQDTMSEDNAQEHLHGVAGLFNQSLYEADAWSSSPIDPNQHPTHEMRKLGSDERIYLLELDSEKTVHAGGLGFTKHWPTFAIATSAEQAERRAREHYAKLGVTVTKARVTQARNQVLAAYVEPEWMIGYTEDTVRSPRAPYQVSLVADQGGQRQVLARYEDVDSLRSDAPAALPPGQEFVIEPGPSAQGGASVTGLKHRHEVLARMAELGLGPLDSHALLAELRPSDASPSP